ncbi:MAG: hypothetical protein BWY61_01356 [Firmicutes bacterium ADurb.Bin354]|nr:MAG: hypothetical protein BWY61_01356 [Firmicutes bacterium ADurb.Bin354]
MESPPILMSPSGFDRSPITKKALPSSTGSVDKYLYAAIRKGICRIRDTEPFTADSGE